MSAAPAAELDITVTAGDGSAGISWTAPADVHAARYIAQAVPGNTALPQATCATTTLSCVIGGLTDGVTYTIEVEAASAVGAVAPPAWSTVTPYPAILKSRASVLWLDADAIPVPVGTPVSFWPDESGQNNGAGQARAAHQPVLSTLGDHTAVEFSGHQNMILAGDRLPSGSTPSEIFAVSQLDDPNAARSCFEHLLAWGSPRTGAARIIYKGCRTPLAYADTYNTYALMHPRDAWPEGQAVLVTAEITGSGIAVGMNGFPDYSWRNPGGVVTDTKLQSTAMIGGAAWWGDSAGWVGRIGEVVILSGNVDAGTKHAVENYLLRKWDISA